MRSADLAFADAADVVRRHGIAVERADVPAPNTGGFDGTVIRVGSHVDDEMALFVLAHLFGHTVQWCTDEKWQRVDARARPGAPPDAVEDARIYEQDASRIGLSLLHAARVDDRDGWLADMAAADWRYLAHYYATGAPPVFARVFSTGNALITAIEIPPFKPARFATRYAF